MATRTDDLAKIITRYRREVAAGSGVELEVRFQGVDYAAFAAIYEGLLNRRPAPAPVLTQMVGTIMSERRPEGAGRAPPAARIREIRFDRGVRTGERFVSKEQLLPPHRVPGVGGGLAYAVALSAEAEVAGRGFSSDEGAVIRAKARASFALTLPGAAGLQLEWRIDAPVVRQIIGSDAASAMPGIVARMFRGQPAMTGAGVLSALHLDTNAAARATYRYEIEVEFLGPPAARDAVRPADVSAAAEAVLRLANPEYMREAVIQAEVYRAARFIAAPLAYQKRFQHELGLKRLLPAALAITRADYRAIYPPRGFFLTDKADGRRALAVARDGRGLVVTDALLEFGAGGGGGGAETIVDGELTAGADGAPQFHAFDVVVVEGEDVSRDGFELRVRHLAAAVAALCAVGVPAHAKTYAQLPVAATAAGSAELEREFAAALHADRPYATDGLILVEPGKPYADTLSYKWKPAAHNTIDFLARAAPAARPAGGAFADAPGCRLHFLFVGISFEMREALGLRLCPGYAELFPEAGRPQSYAPVQFAPSDAPLAYLYQHPVDSPLGADLDGRVVEARCPGDCAAAGGGAPLVAWEVVRIREDRARELSRRYFGNDFYVAEQIWLNYLDPFPFEELGAGPASSYFQRPKTGAYTAQTSVVSFMKSQRIETLKLADWVVDLGAGNGQDLGRYVNAEVQNLIAVDSDRAALSELVRRKYSFAGRAPAGAPARRHARMRLAVHVIAADAAAPAAATLARLHAAGLPAGGGAALVCNLAVHYFLADVAALRNFAVLAHAAVRPGGHVVLTVMLGEAIHALFRAERVGFNGSWDVVENGTVKFSLRRQYPDDTLEAAGQKIGVLLPFSAGAYYTEYLVNTKAVVAEFVARGFTLVASRSATAGLPEFESRNRAVAAQLTPGDRLYLSLMGELVFKR